MLINMPVGQEKSFFFSFSWRLLYLLSIVLFVANGWVGDLFLKSLRTDAFRNHCLHIH